MRQSATRAIWFISASMAMAAICRGGDQRCLALDGRSDYQIVLSAEASPSEQFAADELQSHIKACTGAELPIVTDQPSAAVPTVIVGGGPAAARLGVAPDDANWGEQGYAIRTVGAHVVIAGTRAAGTLYGVYDFLETCLGVRWYAPGTTAVPTLAKLMIPDLQRTVAPPFRWRHTSYTWPGKDAAFLARTRDNSGSGGPDHRHGVQYAFDGTCHSYFRFVDPAVHFEQHPEYFSEIGGVRRRHETQLCLTNPVVLDLATQKMLERMAGMPGCRQHNFSQMDWYNYCQCDKCREVNERLGTTGGTQFWFVNELAKRTAKVYPDKLIGTLAYTFTEEPPRDMRMHPNVAIWLCHMYPSCQSHPITDCHHNADYKRRAVEWSQLCSHLYIWHYVVDFAHYYTPFPNLRAMAADIRFYNDIGAEGVFLQGMGHTGGGGEFSLLRAYYGMKLLWDPQQNADAVLRDFLQGYYGPAAEPLGRYIKMLHDKVDKENVHMHLYTNPAQGYLPDRFLRRAGRLFDEAEEAVQHDARLLERVRVARLPLTYARIFPRNGYKLAEDKLVFQGSIAPVADALAFTERMSAHGFQTIREWGGDPKQLIAWSTCFNAPLPCQRIENQHLLVDVVPFLGGRALRIVDRATAECVTSYNVARNLYFPFAGGEETRLGTSQQAPVSTSFTPFSVLEKADRSIVLEANNMGFNLRRILTLKLDEPVLTVTNVVTNAANKPATLLLRSHLEFDLGELMRTRVSFTNRAGENVQPSMATIVAGLREGEFYRDRQTPAGAWTFTGSNGLRVKQLFDPAQVDSAWLYAYPAELNELEVELTAKTVTLGSGEATTFSHQLEITRASE